MEQLYLTAYALTTAPLLAILTYRRVLGALAGEFPQLHAYHRMRHRISAFLLGLLVAAVPPLFLATLALGVLGHGGRSW